MSDQEPEPTGFDNSWAAWKDRLGISAVVIVVVLLFFFMFTDASINFQCSVTDFIMLKCNRFKREFVPWDKLEEQRRKSSGLRVKGVRVVTVRACSDRKSTTYTSGRNARMASWTCPTVLSVSAT